MNSRSVLVFSCAMGALAGCGSQSSSKEPPPMQVEPTLTATAMPDTPQPAQLPPATPNFAERDGDTYRYIAAVSEEERKKGKSAGDVLSFRYLGFRNGVHRLQAVGDDGSPLELSECASPCRIIKIQWPGGRVERLGFDASSIIGSAFEDAIAGRLTAVPSRATAVAAQAARDESTTIPSAFWGEWNVSSDDCGKRLADWLKVEGRRIRFDDGDAPVINVTVLNSRAVTVYAGPLNDGSLPSDVSLVLSRSGEQLTTGEITRQRCPS